jgi:hypothetical protein
MQTDATVCSASIKLDDFTSKHFRLTTDLFGLDLSTFVCERCGFAERSPRLTNLYDFLFLLSTHASLEAPLFETILVLSFTTEILVLSSAL